jgi:hypothetical protein
LIDCSSPSRDAKLADAASPWSHPGQRLLLLPSGRHLFAMRKMKRHLVDPLICLHRGESLRWIERSLREVALIGQLCPITALKH